MIHEGYPEKFLRIQQFWPKLNFIAFLGQFFRKFSKTVPTAPNFWGFAQKYLAPNPKILVGMVCLVGPILRGNAPFSHTPLFSPLGGLPISGRKLSKRYPGTDVLKNL